MILALYPEEFLGVCPTPDKAGIRISLVRKRGRFAQAVFVE
jgi:hypothetical protein